MPAVFAHFILADGDNLEWNYTTGWRVVDKDGNFKTTV